jgi:hypothetical protein
VEEKTYLKDSLAALDVVVEDLGYEWVQDDWQES